MFSNNTMTEDDSNIYKNDTINKFFKGRVGFLKTLNRIIMIVIPSKTENRDSNR